MTETELKLMEAEALMNELLQEMDRYFGMSFLPSAYEKMRQFIIDNSEG